MNRGRSPRGGRGSWTRVQGRGSARDSPHSQPPRYSPQPGAEGHGPSANDFSGKKEGMSTGGMGSPQDMFPCSSSKSHEHKPAWGSGYKNECSQSEKDSSHAEKLKEGRNLIESKQDDSEEAKCLVASDLGHKRDIFALSNLDVSQNLQKGVERMQIREKSGKMTGNIDNCMPSKFEAKEKPLSMKSTFGHQIPELSENKAVDPPFDLCPPKAGGGVILKPTLLAQNREKRNEIKRSMEQPNHIVLRSGISGMVLLKNYISLRDQMEIVKLCRNLGLGSGGFYQPGYRDGAKLNLKMMCLGKNWDPETSKYGDHRPHDGAKPPCIPVNFFRLVENAIKESHSIIKKTTKASKPEDILPPVTPDICLVNYYSSTGRLGLHQDHDESEQSIDRGLPVVSFSIGDAAEFLYGDQRDVELAKKITLQSGDVLIFGGKSRRIFHGVSSIQPSTAPKTLLEATNLRPGRLNLTFREY